MPLAVDPAGVSVMVPNIPSGGVDQLIRDPPGGVDALVRRCGGLPITRDCDSFKGLEKAKLHAGNPSVKMKLLKNKLFLFCLEYRWEFVEC